MLRGPLRGHLSMTHFFCDHLPCHCLLCRHPEARAAKRRASKDADASTTTKSGPHLHSPSTGRAADPLSRRSYGRPATSVSRRIRLAPLLVPRAFVESEGTTDPLETDAFLLS